MIREATRADVPAVVAMGEHFVAQSSYHGLIASNPAQMTALAEWLIDTPTAALFVAAQDEGAQDITGMIGLALYPHPIAGDVFASELFWWVEPAHRGQGVRLLVRAEQWAKEHGAVWMQMSAPTLEVGELYMRRGYVPMETAYQRSL